MLHHCVLSFRHHRRVHPCRRRNRSNMTGHIGRTRHFISALWGQQFAHERTYPVIFFRALAPQSRLQLQLSNDAILYKSECAVLGPPPISMADYFSVSRALLSRRGRQTERAARFAHLHVSCADKTNFEPPDEIRRTGREFVIR